MKYQFECEGIRVCGDCPCWCPNEITGMRVSNEGFCSLEDIEKRDRFDSFPKDCPLTEVKESEEV